MPLPDWGAADLPPLLAFVAILGGLALRFFKQHGEHRQSQWDQLRDLVADLRVLLKDKDAQIRQKDDLIEQQADHIVQLRHDLKDALKHVRHDRKDPT